MRAPTSPADILLYSTVKIDTYNGELHTGSGTGFFYTVDPEPGMGCFLLVTNKHVLRGSDRFIIRLHIENSDHSREVSPCYMSYDFDRIIHHPDHDIDLCAINVSPLVNLINSDGRRVVLAAAQSNDIPSKEEWENLDAIEDVTMIGCPNGIYDEHNNFPIVRRGITSSNPTLKYNGKSEFLIDMACFPGSSGSPIYLLNNNGYYDRAKRLFISGAQRSRLLGILYAGPMISNSGEVTLGTTGIHIATMMHLGQVIRSSELLVLEQHLRDSMIKELSKP